MKKRPRNYSFYESKSTKNVNVYDYIDTKQDNNDDKNKDSIITIQAFIVVIKSKII
jgi:hypothetical protein